MFLLRLRYALSLQSSNLFVIRFFSHSHNPVAVAVDDAVFSFNRMLNTNPTPPIFEFGKILSSLVKIQHFQTVISLSQQMQLRRIRTDIVNLSILINCFCHLHQVNFVFSVFANILKLGFHPY
ncbi:unnamed protein product [Vicia faba]|uniref:Pentatricopeptide repeat-containing protein n=1 Tax=Vicia faba TaxID=3906 RepID=A0AAV0ZDL9_VICFA|nr:unnamed protein product [Vicia faba]